MRATLNLPPSVRLIGAALEGLVQVNRVLIETRKVPPSALDTNVRYKREGSGLEEWDNALICLQRGWGDCEDLNAWECARINLVEDPDAICTLIRTGPSLYHCVILMSDGGIRDICPALGMRVPGTSLEGIPWEETRAENIIGARAYAPRPSGRTPISQRQRRTRRARRNPNSQYNNPYHGVNAPNAYRPKSSRRTPSSTDVPYQPASSSRGNGPDPMSEPNTTTPGTQSATEMVSPSSVANPTMTMPMMDATYEDPGDFDMPTDEGEEELDEAMDDEEDAS